jgi:hypothetical protein
VGAPALGAVLLALGIAGAPGDLQAVGEDPAVEVTEALRSLGPPGLLWGRLVIEEESPVGAWTPLNGIQVTLYPATPALVAELERVRQSARTSGAQYESAVARVQAALAAHQGRIDRQSPPLPSPGQGLVAEPPLVVAPRAAKPPASPGPSLLRPGGAVPAPPGRSAVPSAVPAVPDDSGEPPHAWREKTDPAGLFAFTAVPSGEWLVVAIRVTAYAAEALRAQPKARQTSRTRNFLPRAGLPAKEAELWVTRVRVVAGERVGLSLTDRARWLVGPLR